MHLRDDHVVLPQAPTLRATNNTSLCRRNGRHLKACTRTPSFSWPSAMRTRLSRSWSGVLQYPIISPFSLPSAASGHSVVSSIPRTTTHLYVVSVAGGVSRCKIVLNHLHQEWALNCACMSQYFIGKSEWAQAAHFLGIMPDKQ